MRITTTAEADAPRKNSLMNFLTSRGSRIAIYLFLDFRFFGVLLLSVFKKYNWISIITNVINQMTPKTAANFPASERLLLRIVKQNAAIAQIAIMADRTKPTTSNASFVFLSIEKNHHNLGL